ncbi:MAG: hypothetical protein Q8842_02655 [Candidatus Phytoplasma australasiaticum]|nr:hypothetical protein [Candidatus Phytoplasma australasiaticum]
MSNEREQEHRVSSFSCPSPPLQRCCSQKPGQKKLHQCIISRDVYIEKEKIINEEIVELRHNTINALIDNNDVIVVSSVSCIFGIGDIEDYKNSILYLHQNQNYPMDALFKKLIELQYCRNDLQLKNGNFRVHGNILDLINSNLKKEAIRLIFEDNKIQNIQIRLCCTEQSVG